jgi:hypothetical protein
MSSTSSIPTASPPGCASSSTIAPGAAEPKPGWVPRTRSGFGPARIPRARRGSVLSAPTTLFHARVYPIASSLARVGGPICVVVQRVLADEVFEVAAADNQEPVEAFAPNASDPALGVRPRLRRPYRRFDDTESFRAEDLIELAAELAVAVTDEQPRPDASVAKLHQQVARLLVHPAAARLGRDPGQVDAPAPQLAEEQDVEALQEERVDSEELTLQDAGRLLTKELGPTRLESLRSRPDPASLTIVETMLAASLIPSPASSAWILR